MGSGERGGVIVWRRRSITQFILGVCLVRGIRCVPLYLEVQELVCKAEWREIFKFRMQ